MPYVLADIAVNRIQYNIDKVIVFLKDLLLKLFSSLDRKSIEQLIRNCSEKGG